MTVRTTCPYCGVGCGVVVSATGGVKGDPLHPANRGRLCSKGAALAETLDDAQRLTHPMVHGKRTSWDEAMELVTERFAHTIAEYGPGAVAFYASGQFLTEDYYVANKLMKGFIGSGNIDTNSRLCMASTVAGQVRAFGADVVPGVYEDWEEADLVVLVGSNTAWCHPVLYQRLVAAKETRRMRVVTIDPRRTATTEISDLHLALAPGSDVALFAGLLVQLAAVGATDQAWTARHTTGLEESLAEARRFAASIGDVADMTGLPPQDIATFFDWFAATERTVTVFSQGVNQSSAGTDKVNAIVNCHLATGRIGRPGMGPFSVTGQPNAMGGREVGGLANQLAAHMTFDDAAAVDRVCRFWNAPRIATKPGLKAVDLFDAVLDGRIQALWIMATNPADSMPRADRVRRALEICPFVVVSDCWNTDTTARAHVVLPAAGWGEKDGTVTNSERRISRQRSFRAPPGEARPDWAILADFGRRMGWPRAFFYSSPAEIFREHAALSAFENNGRRAFDIGALAALNDREYDELAPTQWPVRVDNNREETKRFFADGRFFTPDGRAHITPTRLRQLAAAKDHAYPFVLNTGRVRDQWHTMTRTGLVPRLMRHESEPVLSIHPKDAAGLALEEGELVRVETAHGSTVLRARQVATQREGEVFASMHWTDRFASGGAVARLVSAVCDPISGQPELKATAASLAPVRTHWHGLLVRRHAEMPQGDFHCVRNPGYGAHLFRLRGLCPLPSGADLREMVEELLDPAADAEWVEFSDPAHGNYRFATLADDRLLAWLFLTRGGCDRLPAEETITELFRNRLGERERVTVLTGGPFSGMPVDLSPLVCTCFSVTADSLREAVRRNRLTTIAQIGDVLKAGTNCGSCRLELAEFLRGAPEFLGNEGMVGRPCVA